METKEEQLNEILARNLKEKRMKRGISQLKLANLCDISQSFIGEIEAGRKYPSLKTLELIANRLQVEPYQLLFSESDKLEYDREYLLNEIKVQMRERISEEIAEVIDTFQS